jgi:hypothetical protein
MYDCVYPQNLSVLVQQEFQGRQRHLSLRRSPSMEESVNISSPTAPIIHFVETAPSMLREMPSIQLREHKVYMYLYPSCNKYCDLIGQEQVSISHINL